MLPDTLGGGGRELPLQPEVDLATIPQDTVPAATVAGDLALSAPPGPTSYCEMLLPLRPEEELVT